MSEFLTLMTEAEERGFRPAKSVQVSEAALAAVPHEIVYVDDGSTDDTPAVLAPVILNPQVLSPGRRRARRHAQSGRQRAGLHSRLHGGLRGPRRRGLDGGRAAGRVQAAAAEGVRRGDGAARPGIGRLFLRSPEKRPITR